MKSMHKIVLNAFAQLCPLWQKGVPDGGEWRTKCPPHLLLANMDSISFIRTTCTFMRHFILIGIAVFPTFSALAFERPAAPMEAKSTEDITKAIERFKGFGNIESAQLSHWGRQVFTVWYCPFSGRDASYLHAYYYDHENSQWTRFIDQLVEKAVQLSVEMPIGEDVVIFKRMGDKIADKIAVKESVAKVPQKLKGEVVGIYHYLAYASTWETYKRDCMKEYSEEAKANNQLGLLVKDGNQERVYQILGKQGDTKFEYSQYVGSEVEVEGASVGHSGLHGIWIKAIHAW